jgi:protoporphyrinogen oxidase
MYSGLAVERVEPLPDGALSVTDHAGKCHRFDQVAAAVPLPRFLKLAAGLPDDYRRRLSDIHYLGVICVVLRLRHSLSPYFWLNVNDARVHFNGCIEYSNLNREVAPDGASVLYVPYYLPADHSRFRLPDSDIVAECLAALKVLNPRFQDDWVLDTIVSRDALAQVVCSVGFRHRVPPFETPVRNLYLMESAQLYPADRNISQMIDLAHDLAEQMAGPARGAQ